MSISEFWWSSVFEILSSPYSVAIFAAIFTVGLTVYVTHRKRRLDTLKAVLFEISENERIAAQFIDYIGSDIDQRTSAQRGYLSTVIEFRTFAFENLVRNGTLLSMQESRRSELGIHYELLEQVNTELEQYRELRFEAGEFSPLTRTEKIKGYIGRTTSHQKLFLVFDSYLLTVLYCVLPEDVEELDEKVHEVYRDNLEYIDEDAESLADVRENEERDVEKAQFQYIRSIVEEEMESHRILSRLPGF